MPSPPALAPSASSAMSALSAVSRPLATAVVGGACPRLGLTWCWSDFLLRPQGYEGQVAERRGCSRYVLSPVGEMAEGQ
jgi:hypothetical protein